ncbi:zinc-binding dehydrogenase [Rhodobacterales bacterium FZCC0069]|nr:zinc-binding dehydrogenase [Rhodobacterales bacterium FZCC0069]
MKQVLQSVKTGATDVADVPVPSTSPGCLLVQTSHTLVSAGTERMLVEFGKAGWIGKARQQPDKVKMVRDKISTDGLQPTLAAVFNKLDQPIPLGYCNVGRVAELGSGVLGFANGDRVVSNGNHAEVVSVPQNLCAKVPDVVSDEEAAFTVLGAIALQGIRHVAPTLGEAVVVTGLGLIGLMTVQLLRANGCRVLGLDFDPAKLEMARQFGADVVDLASGQNPVTAAETFSRGRGVDAVIVTAATKSSEPIQQAALMCRKRGRIVLVGVTGLDLSRDVFFKKELTFQVSASYGPGRHDPSYEEKGHDYPIGFVRWTEQRNFEAILDMMAMGQLNVRPLISHRFAIAEAEKAYKLIVGSEPSLGILLTYPGIELSAAKRSVSLNELGAGVRTALDEPERKVRVSFIGAGSYATSVLIPEFKAAGSDLRSVASRSGVSGVHAGRKFGFSMTTTDSDLLFADTETDAVVITTRHDSHAHYVLQALQANKHVFVEKPLCLTLDELVKIESCLAHNEACGNSPMLMVGFNRRFAPQVQKMKLLLQCVDAPKSIVMTVNAGAISSEHWTQDLEMGGGRIVGEACHFIDLLRFMIGVPITSYKRLTMDSKTKDTVTLQLAFLDGSIGTVHYFANGSKSFPKERLEVFAAGGVLQLDNYRKLTGFNWPGFKKMNLLRQDKGQRACSRAFIDAVAKGSVAPIPLDEVMEVSRIAIELANFSS